MTDPVAWLMIEHGWDVVSSGGEKIGHVDEVLGDTATDIFSGLNVSAGLFKGKRYVPAERIAAIYEGRVELDLDAATLGRLDEHGPGAETRPS